MTAIHAQHDGFFSSQFLAIKAFATAYVIAIPLSHYVLPSAFVWDIALFFLLLMLPPYVFAARGNGRLFALELKVAVALAAVALVGYGFGAPAMIILAIFGHGVWDIAKQLGAGVPFFRWYLVGCVLVDWTYAAALMIYLMGVGA